MIKNITNGEVISEKVKLAKSFSDKTFGMILSRNSGGLMFKTRFGIHTFFMKKSIDVIVLDKEDRVRQISEDLKPNNIFLWNPKFNTIIELPHGSIKSSKTKVGDSLKF